MADGRIPERLRKIDRDEDFILFEDEKLIIFATKTNLSLLKEIKHWFADGTFKVSWQISVLSLPSLINSFLGVSG